MRTKSTGGFTLIELLIVIAIIGILAAVLIPNLLSARTRAFDTAAQACAKGIATAAEVHNIDAGTYTGLTMEIVQANGGNACAGEVVGTVTPSADGASYSGTAKHNASDTTWNVTPSGIVRAPGS